jgi:hypothetical protein
VHFFYAVVKSLSVSIPLAIPSRSELLGFPDIPHYAIQKGISHVGVCLGLICSRISPHQSSHYQSLVFNPPGEWTSTTLITLEEMPQNFLRTTVPNTRKDLEHFLKKINFGYLNTNYTDPSKIMPIENILVDFGVKLVKMKKVF